VGAVTPFAMNEDRGAKSRSGQGAWSATVPAAGSNECPVSDALGDPGNLEVTPGEVKVPLTNTPARLARDSGRCPQTAGSLSEGHTRRGGPIYSPNAGTGTRRTVDIGEGMPSVDISPSTIARTV